MGDVPRDRRRRLAEALRTGLLSVGFIIASLVPTARFAQPLAHASDAGILAVMFVAFTALASRVFRWE